MLNGLKNNGCGQFSLRYAFGFLYYFTRLIGYIPSQHIRKSLYKMLGMKIGARSIIYHGADVRFPWRITIGNSTIINDKAILDGRCGITIGENVNLGTGVWIWTLEHDHEDPFFGPKGGPVVIEDYAWISCRTIILPNVRIGKGAVVAAGAVVAKDIPPYTIASGIPARVIGTRNQDLRYQLGVVPPPPEALI